MMATLERQSLLSEQFARSQDRAQWLNAVRKMAREFDFTYGTLMREPLPEDDLLGSVVLESTVSLQFLHTFDQNRFLPHCPVLSRVASSLMPQCWSLDDDNSQSPYPVRMERLMRQFGIINGVMIPVNGLNGQRHILRLDGDCNRPTQAALNEIGMLALHAFDVFNRLYQPDLGASKALTKRELEVIHWTSQGKTSAEIGQILSLSDHTINAYLNNAMKKLDCVNRTQLVAKAIRIRLIA